MISASKCRPLNSAGRLRLMQAEAYQGAECRCNTAARLAVHEEHDSLTQVFDYLKLVVIHP
jgi:hypothetical protein